MSNFLNQLDFYIDKYQMEENSDERVEHAEQLLKEFQEKYSKEKFKNMKLEEYALGKEENSYSWWLEYYSEVLGSIKGGIAKKHIIYFSRDHQEWIYPDEFSNEIEAWEKLREDFCELIDHVGDIKSTNLLSKANMVKTKTIYLFYPDRFLPVYSIADMILFLQELGVDKLEYDSIKNDSLKLNQFLKSKLEEIPQLKNWHPVKIMHFLYYSLKKGKTKYVKISPGENACFWEQCKEGNYISIGWNEIGDLTKYPDYHEFKKEFIRTFQKSDGNNKKKTAEKANEVWLFYNLSYGDRVIVNKGTSQILGIGTVTEAGYQYVDHLPLKHTIQLKWDEIPAPINIPEQKYWAFKTVYELNEKEVNKWLEGKTNTKLEAPKVVTDVFSDAEEAFFKRMDKLLERKGQCILYGPPGTGKTYSAQRYIKWKLQNDEKDRLDHCYEICTFHPSYTYEDFIEGFKPASSNNGQVSFTLEDGIFKRFCEKARNDQEMPYFFIIDELNRGNVPKIFGELITMLEHDKRGVQIILPQSKKPFSIPKNVFLIATMNTSDRSIKMLDAALKRRFGFIECLPNYEVIDTVIDGINLSPAAILRKLNQRLVEKGGRDKQIGHSYFMKSGEQILTIDDLKDVLEFEIIPLLQEYCFDRYEDLAKLLGEEFVNVEEMTINTEVFSGQNDIFIDAIHSLIEG